jgi:alkylation response protein AidB-like acyl-CoA dehydrogenase
MNNYTPPLTDIRFVLHEMIAAESVFQPLEGWGEVNRELLDAVLEESGRFSGQVLAPLNQPGDEEGCSFDKASGSVTTPKGFKDAFAQFVDGGWTGLCAPTEFGGQDMPLTLGAAVEEMLDAANLSWSTYPLLSHGAKEALLHHGEAWQQEVFLKPIVEGVWTGTMCLTEPHCGSDLGLLKTRAEPQAGDTYAISGTKIFITAGEHDLTENIIHLVLARLPDAPPGVKGISLFIVPKFKVARDGTVGERNTVRAGSIEHKMGIKGSATCVMNFDAAEGYLIGQPHRGLAAMFTMMNTARLGVGLQGLGLMERAYQNSLAYARDRLQMRSMSGPKRPDKPADPIIVHPDVRRMLLTQKALIEGSRALGMYAYLQADLRVRAADPQARKDADDLLGFLTPIVKACLTEWSVEGTYHALQCFGGHGYIREWGMEQLARDARITTIYEGTTQIQALDLLGRKVLQLQGAGLRLFASEISAFCSGQLKENEQLLEFIAPLAQVTQDWVNLTQDLAQSGMKDPDEIGAAAVDYLFYSGYVALAYMFTRMASAVVDPASGQTEAFRDAKLATARFYFQRILPRIHTHVGAIRAGSVSLMAMPEEQFGQ